ncbi:MAG: hypothetical protein A3I78_09040 [Gammaproteobacteria bacterium RIFCSPLOWO2_02_FULL_56_15]|nr:MAG: hypothetical protein A3I78_09040 [Gammaproteobacteria bacterium RIFCSPLOWO2_02_FULL_56_15]
MNNGRKTRIKSAKSDNRTMTLREELKQVTHERLLNAAKELFEQEGAETVTVDQIARQAGTNRTTFYLHFEDKTDIAFKIRSRYRDGDIRSITHYLTGGNGVSRNDILKWIRHRSSFFRKHRAIIQLGTESLNKKPELMQEFMDQTIEILNAGFAGFLGKFGQDERELVLAELLLCSVMLNRYLYITVIQEVKLPFKTVPDAIVEIWFNLLSRQPGNQSFNK